MRYGICKYKPSSRGIYHVVFHSSVSFMRGLSEKRDRSKRNGEQSVILLVICCAAKLNYLVLGACRRQRREKLDLIAGDFAFNKVEIIGNTLEMYLITPCSTGFPAKTETRKGLAFDISIKSFRARGGQKRKTSNFILSQYGSLFTCNKIVIRY